MDVRLSVPSPIGNVYKGNQHRHGEDEQFSTVHRVIVPKQKVLPGESVVHVILPLGGRVPRAPIARVFL